MKGFSISVIDTKNGYPVNPMTFVAEPRQAAIEALQLSLTADRVSIINLDTGTEVRVPKVQTSGTIAQQKTYIDLTADDIVRRLTASAPNSITVVWTFDDLRPIFDENGEEFTEEKGRAVFDVARRNFNADYGILDAFLELYG